MSKLDNPKRERFCREYVIDSNGAQAAIRAGYSKRTAKVLASQLLTNLNVQQRVMELQAAVAQRLEITQDSVLREIDETRIAAASVAQHATALKAAELKGKHIGMWPNRSEVNVTTHLEGLTVDQLATLRAAIVGAIADAEDAVGGDRSAIH